MQQQFNIAVLISGRGSNLLSILNARSNFEVIAVASDKSDAGGLQIATDSGVRAVHAFPRQDFSSKAQQKSAIYDFINSINPDLICLAGFMQILEPDFVSRHYGKIINIHPSLLPNLPGLDTHARALQSGLKHHGCSVHFVDSGLDSGPVIAQARCKVLQNDNVSTLSERVLSLEHLLYPWVIKSIAARDIILDTSADNKRGNIRCTEKARNEAAAMGIILASEAEN